MERTRLAGWMKFIELRAESMKPHLSLIQMIFGEQAEAARKLAPERLLRWDAAFERWLSAAQTKGSSKYHHSKIAWQDFLALLHAPPWEAQESDVRAYYSWLVERNASAATISKRLSRLASFYRFVHADLGEEGAVYDPTENVKRPYKWWRQAANYLSVTELQALLDAIDRDATVIGKRDYAIILASLTCGLRHADLLGLRWGDLEVDEANSRAWARRQSTRRRRAELPMAVVDAMRDYLAAAGRLETIQPEAFIFAPVRSSCTTGPQQRPEDWDAGRPVGKHIMSLHLKRYAAWAGLDETQVDFPLLRTTALMLRLEAGDTPQEMCEFFDYYETPYIAAQIGRLKRRLKQPLWKAGQPAAGAGADNNSPPEGTFELAAPGRGPYRRSPHPAQSPVPHLKHGLYARALPESEMALAAQERQDNLDGEIDAMRVVMTRTLQRVADAADPKDQLRLLEVFSTAAYRLGQLIKTRRELDGGQNQLETLIQSISQEILSEHGWPEPGEEV